MAEKRSLPKSRFQGDLKLGGIYWKDAVHVRQSEGLNQWQKNHFRLMKMVEYQESVVQGALERLLTRIGIEYSRKEYVPTNDEILDKLMSIDPEVQKLVLLNGKAAAMEMFVKQNYDLQGRYRNIFQGGRVPRNMTMKVINDYLDEIDAPSMEPSALETYTSQMRTGLAEVTQRHIAKSVAQMTAWNWSRGRGIEELTRRFQEEQKKEQIDMSKVLPNAETVVRTESMKILNAEAWRSATEVGSYADGLLWGFSYHAVGDSRTRQTHLAQHGVCAPVDDPFWNEWTPPNGYNCRCWLISEWEEPSSYKQPRRDLHPDPGFAFNPANNVSGRVPQQKKQEQKKQEVNTQPQESVGKPDELGKNDAVSEKNFEKKAKKIQKPVTTQEKKRYNNIATSQPTLTPTAPPSPEPLIPEVQNGTIIPTPDGKFIAIHGPMVKTTTTREAAAQAIRDAGGTVQEEKPEIKPDNNPENREEQENNDSKNGITEQEVQTALKRFHSQNQVDKKKKLIVSLLPNGRLVVKDGEEIVATIEPSKSGVLQLSANKRFYAVVNKIADVYSSLLSFFEDVSNRNKNANIVFESEEKKPVRGIEEGSFLPTEKAKKQGWMIGNTDNDTEAERKMFDELRSLGLNLIRIDTSEKEGEATSDTWILQGWRIKKLELKSLTTKQKSTIQGHISHAIEQKCQLLLLDMRKSPITFEEISRIVRRYIGGRIPRMLPIDLEIWLNENEKLTRYSRKKDK